MSHIWWKTLELSCFHHVLPFNDLLQEFITAGTEAHIYSVQYRVSYEEKMYDGNGVLRLY